MKKLIYHALEDPTYAHPYIDERQMRTRKTIDGKVIDYLYIHGGFEGTIVKFTSCFTDKAGYTERIFQYLPPFSGTD